MRHIDKGSEPRALLDWKRDNRTTPQNLKYGAGSFPYEAVRQALLAEQFHVCAYTLKALRTPAECQADGHDTSHACHIEHVLPQSRGVDAESIDYQNMLACFPPSHDRVGCEYGARAKADYDPAVRPFISPLHPAVEQHFRYESSGEIDGITTEGTATITVLRLNHPALIRERAAVIKGRLEPKPGKPLSAKAARRLAAEIVRPDGQKRLTAFCIAIAQAALAHAEREERRAARMRKKDSA